MSLILNIETATRNCSVALSKDGEVTSLAEIAGEGYLHAEKLHIFIEEVVQNAGFTLKELTAVAVSMGPGSYTGLRIGVSAAKGLCYALGLPLIAIDTLEVIARQITVGENEFIVPLIDARRMEVYSAMYTANYSKVRDIKAEIITAESFGDFDGSSLHMIGDGAAKCVEFLNSDRFVYHPNVLFPSAAQMCNISFDKYKKSDTVDVAYFEPFYLKDFIVNK